jgi:hypothetical protein
LPAQLPADDTKINNNRNLRHIIAFPEKKIESRIYTDEADCADCGRLVYAYSLHFCLKAIMDCTLLPENIKAKIIHQIILT